MSEEFIIHKKIRRRRRVKDTPIQINSKTLVSIPSQNTLPQYLIDPPSDHTNITLQNNHTNELVCSFRVAKEILGSSFRPKESNLAIGKIRI